jgi:hypothetical protein
MIVYVNELIINRSMNHESGRSAAWLARLHGVQEAGGSNPLAPTSSKVL